MAEPLDLDAIGARADAASPGPWGYDTYLRASLSAAEAERDRYREHSTTLNTVGYALAVALRRIPAGAESGEGDPVEDARTLIADRDRLAATVARVRELAGSWPGHSVLVSTHEISAALDGPPEAPAGPASEPVAAEQPPAGGSGPTQAQGGSEAVDHDLCPPSKRVDGIGHSWRFDGDAPRIVCVFCDQIRDAVTGEVLRAGGGR